MHHVLKVLWVLPKAFNIGCLWVSQCSGVCWFSKSFSVFVDIVYSVIGRIF